MKQQQACHQVCVCKIDVQQLGQQLALQEDCGLLQFLEAVWVCLLGAAAEAEEAQQATEGVCDER